MSAGVLAPDGLRADVIRAQRGDRDAFIRIVDACKGVVCAIALAIVRDVAASEDVAQDVFLAAWTGLGRLKNPESFLPWMRQLTRNRAREANRSRRRVDLAAEDAIASAVSPGPAASESLLEAEEQRALAEAIDELPDESREVITLYYREGRSAAQVAALLGLREDAVKKRLSRGRERLRESVRDKLGDVLEKSAPESRFTHAVIVALPIAGPTAGGTAAALLAKAGKALAIVGGGAALGTASGLAGIWLGARRQRRRARTEAEHRALTRMAVAQTALVIVAAAGFYAANRTANPPAWGAVVFVSFFVSLMSTVRWWRPRAEATWDAEECAKDPNGHARRKLWAKLAQVVMWILGAAFAVYLVIDAMG